MFVAGGLYEQDHIYACKCSFGRFYVPYKKAAKRQFKTFACIYMVLLK